MITLSVITLSGLHCISSAYQIGLRLFVPHEGDDGPDAVRDLVGAVAVIVGAHQENDYLKTDSIRWKCRKEK